jgi:hypothetical protein
MIKAIFNQQAPWRLPPHRMRINTAGIDPKLRAQPQ